MQSFARCSHTGGQAAHTRHTAAPQQLAARHTPRSWRSSGRSQPQQQFFSPAVVPQPGVLAAAAAGQPDRAASEAAAGAAGAADRQHRQHEQESLLTSGQQALQAYAELQQQQPDSSGGDNSDSSWRQRLVVQAGKLPNQADQLWGDPSDREARDVALVEPATRSYADLDYLSVSWLVGARGGRGGRVGWLHEEGGYLSTRTFYVDRCQAHTSSRRSLRTTR